MVVFGGSFIGLMLLPVDFGYWAFALLITANSASIMSSVPARYRGVASGMRSTYQNSGTALSIGMFFSLMIAGLASCLPETLTTGLQRQGVPYGIAHHIGTLPPVSPGHALASLSAAGQRTVTGREVFPDLISAPFHHGLMVVFVAATSLAGVAALASWLRGGR